MTYEEMMEMQKAAQEAYEREIQEFPTVGVEGLPRVDDLGRGAFVGGGAPRRVGTRASNRIGVPGLGSDPWAPTVEVGDPMSGGHAVAGPDGMVMEPDRFAPSISIPAGAFREVMPLPARKPPESEIIGSIAPGPGSGLSIEDLLKRY